ncbi:MAG: hypothetical protein JKY31_01890 [Rhodobacteraceae bacterium]|nr:hypothetical protein [Paracoccaceae bacterium]
MNQEFIQLFGARVARSQIVSVYEESRNWPAIYKTVLILIGILWTGLIVSYFLEVEPVFSEMSTLLEANFKSFPDRTGLYAHSMKERVLFFIIPLLAVGLMPLYALSELSWRLVRLRPVVVLTNAKLKGRYTPAVLSNATVKAIADELEKPNSNFKGFLPANLLSLSYSSGHSSTGRRYNLITKNVRLAGRPIYSELGPDQPIAFLWTIGAIIFDVVRSLIGAALLIWFGFIAYAAILYGMEFEYAFSSGSQIKSAFVTFFTRSIMVLIVFVVGTALLGFIAGWVFRDYGSRVRLYQFDGNRVFWTSAAQGGVFEQFWLQAGLNETIKTEFDFDLRTNARFGWDAWLLHSYGGSSMADRFGFIDRPVAD